MTMMKKVVGNYWTTAPFWLAVALLSVCVAFKNQANRPNQPNQRKQNFDTERNNRPPPPPPPALQGQTHPKAIKNNNDDDRANQGPEDEVIKNYLRQIQEYLEYKRKLDENFRDVVPPVSNKLDQHEINQIKEFQMELKKEHNLFKNHFQTMDDAAKMTRLAEIDDLDKRMAYFSRKLTIQNKIFNACPTVYQMADIIIFLKSCYLGLYKQDQEQGPQQNNMEAEKENKLIPMLLDKNSANRTTSGVQQLLDKLLKHKVSVSIVSMVAILLGSLSLIPAKSRDNYWEQIKEFFVSASSDIKSSLNKQHGISFIANTNSPPRNAWWWFAPVCAALLLLAMMVGGWILWSRSRNKPIKKQELSKPATTETNSTGSIPNTISGGGKSAKQQQKFQKNQHHIISSNMSLQKSKKPIKSLAS